MKWRLTSSMAVVRHLYLRYYSVGGDIVRQEYCEKNGILITYTDKDVAFEERDTAMSILISNEGEILHNNFSDNKDKTQQFLDDFHRIYPTVCYFRSLDQMGDAV